MFPQHSPRQSELASLLWFFEEIPLVRILIVLLGILFLASAVADEHQSTNNFTLASKIQIPLEVGGKQVGSIVLLPGTKVNLLQWDGTAFLASSQGGKTFRISKGDLVVPEGVDLDEVAHDLLGGGNIAAGPTLNIASDHPILISDRDLPVETTLTVTPQNFPKDAILTYSWEQVQDVLSPFAATMGRANPISFSSTNSPSTKLSIIGAGVFEVRLTVTDSKSGLTRSKNAWINVWSSRSPIVKDGKEDPLCAAPGIQPPPSVRTLSPDPGPYCHPRLYTTAQDWPELRDRVQHGKIASMCLGSLRRELADRFDKPDSDFSRLSDQLVKFADFGFQGPAPDLTMGIPSKPGDKGPDWNDALHHFFDYINMLRDATLVAWIDQDPKTPHDQVPKANQERFRRLAKITSSIGYIVLNGCWDAKTGVFHKEYPIFPGGLDEPGGICWNMSSLGLAYDFTGSWMTTPEKKAIRDFLYAQSVGRTTGARTVGFASGIHGRLQRGYEQNGDFMNIDEEKVLNAMVLEGEEASVSPAVVKAFTDLPVPKDHLTSPDYKSYDWVQSTTVDTMGACLESHPYSVACSWPFARKVAVDNLQRAIWFNDDGYVSPWGFTCNREAYYGFSAWGLWPTAVAYARHGAENQFVTSLFYNTVLQLLYSCYQAPTENKSDNYSSHYFLYDHHDGGGDYRQNHVVMMKYMYPDDPAVDYIYFGNAPGLGFNPFIQTLFGLDPGINGKPTTLEDVGRLKSPVLTKVDPPMGVVVCRTGWDEEAMKLDFDEGPYGAGHMHAEKGNFSLFALGRPWSFAPGYHVTDSTWQSEVLIQDPRYAKDAVTQGFMGEGPNQIPEGSDYKRCFPTPPGKLIDVTENEGHNCVIMAGDNATAYSYCYGDNQVETPLRRRDFLYPGLYDMMISHDPNLAYGLNEPMKLTTNYNPVQYAYRTILFVRGEHPYALIIDDIEKDGTPRNYRWQMNCSTMFGPPSLFTNSAGEKIPSDLDSEPGATASQAVLLHSPLDLPPPNDSQKAGLPRLLVRDFSDAADQVNDPAIEVSKQSGTKEGKDIDIHRLFITKNHVVRPGFKVLLYPFRTGEKLPETKWNEDHTKLTIDFGGGKVDTISIDRSNPDHRSRVSFSRLKG